jgi:hypothetical protein
MALNDRINHGLEVVKTDFIVLSQQRIGGTGENNDKPQSGLLVSMPKVTLQRNVPTWTMENQENLSARTADLRTIIKTHSS